MEHAYTVAQRKDLPDIVALGRSDGSHWLLDMGSVGSVVVTPHGGERVTVTLMFYSGTNHALKNLEVADGERLIDAFIESRRVRFADADAMKSGFESLAERLPMRKAKALRAEHDRLLAERTPRRD